MNFKKVFLLLFAFFLFSFSEAKAFNIDYNDGIYTIKIPMKEAKKRLKFVSSTDLISNREAHKKAMAVLTVNAGFFDPKNGKTISYIVSDNLTVEDPLFNENLMSNSILRQNMSKILNRTEFRVLECDREVKFEITQHNSSVDFPCLIKTSAQAGPLVYPKLNLEEEFFVSRNSQGKVLRDSISALSKVPRTIIALKDKDIYILIITKENPMTLPEVHDLCEKMGFDRAMAFDGGSSTSMNYKNLIEVTSTNSKSGRLLKSFLILK